MLLTKLSFNISALKNISYTFFTSKFLYSTYKNEKQDVPFVHWSNVISLCWS